MGRKLATFFLACLLVGCGGDDSEGGGKKDAGTGGKGGTGTGGVGAKDGGTGGSSATGGKGGTGGTGGCTSKDDCLAPGMECVTAACNNGICGTESLPAGTPAGTPISGDCKKSQCDGAGKVETVPDDTDVEDDNNPCTTDSCNGGSVVHAPVSVGTLCNGASFCDAQGKCVQCLAPTDCGAATECATPTCTNGVCGPGYVPDNTATNTQTSGDCKQRVCDGAGAVKTINLDTDLPNDNNTCTIDGCNAGTPTYTPEPNKVCGTNQICNAQGQCVGCTQPSDCAGTDDFCKTRTCVNNICGFSYTADHAALPTGQVTGDCATLVCDGNGGTKNDPNASDPLNDNKECTLDQCAGTTPQNVPQPGSACTQGGGKVCDDTGACVACLVPSDCANPSGYPCVVATCPNATHTCGTANASSTTNCGTGPSCSNGTQKLQDKCNGSGSCATGASTNCSPYACNGTVCGTSCSGDPGCAAGYSCDTGLQVCTNGPKCTDYCNVIDTNCNAPYEQYFSMTACLNSCATLPRGTVGETSGNTVGCRTYHAGAAASGASLHCPHAGPGGDGACGTNCEGFCTIALATCTGANLVYSSLSQCMTECATFPTSPVYSTSVTTGNSFACRLYHLTNATTSAANATVHCPHIKASSSACF